MAVPGKACGSPLMGEEEEEGEIGALLVFTKKEEQGKKPQHCSHFHGMVCGSSGGVNRTHAESNLRLYAE
ncbi:uncharacterized [Tachysurus ichikawai]